MKRLFSFFRGLRGKLTLTYTLVTVLALLALEIMILAAFILISSATDADKRSYLSDVVYTLYPQAGKYLQPGKQNLPGLQAWLEQVHSSGYASEEPMNAFDSPAAVIVQDEPMYVLSPDGVVLAQAPNDRFSQVGQTYAASDLGSQLIIEHAVEGNFDTLGLVTSTPGGDYQMAVPVPQADRYSDVVGVVILTIQPPPPMFYQIWPTLLSWVMVTSILLLLAVAPFGALFGFIMSRGLTRRLGTLTNAADAWSEGDFRPLPVDRSRDEIGYLGMRMRHMAERVQNLLQTQQQLAMMEERNRLARELHDTVKQQNFATLMQLRAARNLLATEPEAAQAHLTEAEALIKNTQQELSLIIAELRPAALDGQGLAGALQHYLDTWSQHSRIPATLHVLNERALPFEVEQALYRVAQEALSNVARHSRASAATLRLAFEPEQVSLSIADNGVGFPPAEQSRGGYGLQSMKERLESVHGQLVVESSSGNGTTLLATVPTK